MISKEKIVKQMDNTINQGGNNNLNIVNNNGSIYLNQKSECNLSDEKICSDFIVASEDLNAHKSFFGKDSNISIERKEVKDIEDWIFKDLDPNDGTIAVIAGNAGFGKSVIAKQLFHSLSSNQIPVLALKSDKLVVNNIEELISELGFEFQIDDLVQKLSENAERTVVIIDQIDALSQSLSSNRNPLNTYNRLIYRISKISSKVRLIISCRIYDLEYDPYLQQYNNLKKFIVRKLDDDEIKQVLKGLEINPDTLSPKFLDFLKVPIHLEIFSVVLDKNKPIEFSSLQELYAEYWRKKILIDTVKDSSALAFIKELSNKMFTNQCITIDQRPFENRYLSAIRFLISEGVIVSNGNKIQFVHQSFFDYTNARCFVDDGRSISNEILKENNHQGLFIRSGLRHVLTYLREIRVDEYINELRILLSSEKLRFHLKLLIINELSFLNTPNEAEKQIIKELNDKNEFLFKIFIESANSEKWLRFLFENMHIQQNLEINFIEYGNYIFQALRKMLYMNSNLAIRYLSQLPESDEKKNLISRLLLFVNDFSNVKILDLFDTYSDPNDIHVFFSFLENALKQYPDWVIKKLKIFFENTKPDNLGHLFSKHYEEGGAYEELLKEQPEKAIEYFVELLMLIGNKDREALKKAGIDTYFSGHQFMFYAPQKGNNSSHELLFFICDSVMDYFEKQYSTKKTQIEYYIDQFTSTKSLILHSLVIPTFIKFKEELSDSIFRYLTQYSELFIEFEGHNVYEYYFRELLKESYPLFSVEQKLIINNLILNAIPVEEKTKSYRFQKGVTEKGMLWHGLTMFKLLSMIPEVNRKEFRSIDTKYQELKRKFEKVPNKKPTGIVVTSGETIMKNDAYEYMTFEHWKQTFREYKGDDSPPWDEKVSEIGHSRKFEELCKIKPEKFHRLIEEIIDDKTIPVSYIVYGFDGLTKSDFSADKIADLFKKFITHRKDELIGFPLQMTVWLTDYFIKNELIGDTIIPFLCDAITNQSDKQPLNNDLVTDAINSPRGAAIDRLVKCYNFKTFEEEIFSTLENIAFKASSVTRAAAISRLALLNNLNSERNLNLFLNLMWDYDPGLLSIPLHDLHPLVYLIHVDFKRLIPFFEKAIEIEESHQVISHILFFAWLNDYERSKELLDNILSKSVIAKSTVVKIAFANLEFEKSFEKCFAIVMQFLDEDEKEIADKYEHAFYQLKPNLFPQIEPFLFNYVDSKVGIQRDSSFYKYLQKCLQKYQSKKTAEKCIELTLKFRNHLKPDISQRSLTKEPLQVVIDAYSVIRDYHIQTEHLEFAMDAFDSMLKIPEYRGNMKTMLNKMDESLL